MDRGCGRRVTGGWSNHAVNTVTPFPRGLCNNSSIKTKEKQKKTEKAMSRLADGMEEAETIWPEVTELTGRLVESWWMRGRGCRCFVDQMTLVHRRIVGRWTCQRHEPRPILIVMPVVGRTVMCGGGSGPDCLSFTSLASMQALWFPEHERVPAWIRKQTNKPPKTYLPERAATPPGYRLYRQTCEGLLL